MARKKTLKSTIDEAAAMLAPAVPVPPASGDILESLTDLEALLAYCLMAEIHIEKGPTYYVVNQMHWCYFIGGYRTNFLRDMRSTIRDVMSAKSALRARRA